MEQPVGKAGRGFQRMAEGVAEIEQRALAGLALVARHDRGLGAAGGGDGMFARRAAGEDLGVVGLEPGEEGLVAEHAIFGDLGIAGAELARRQRVEHRGIGDHQDRLVKRAEQVLALRRIDPGLAADRGIDLRQQRGRHLHEIDAAAQDGGGEAGEVADHAAAERDHQIVALDLRRDQRLADLLEAGIGFRALALPDNDGDVAIPACDSDASVGSSQCLATVRSVTMAVRAPGRKAAMRAPSDGSTSRPMTMS